MGMTGTSSDHVDTPRKRPGDPQAVSRIVSDYRGKISQLDSLRGEINSEKKRIDRDREALKAKLDSMGVSSSKELKERLEELANIKESGFYQLESEYERLQSEVQRLEGEKGIYEERISESRSLISKKNLEKEKFEEALVFLREVSDAARAEIIYKFENFVTQALEKVFGTGLLKFKIDIKTKNHVPNVDFQLHDLVTDEMFDILDSYGGGVADVVSIVLRLALLEMQDPVNTGPIILDEVGKFLSDDHQDKFGEFLHEWAKEFDRQIVLVTHKPGVLKHANRIFRVTKTDSVSIVDVVNNDEEKEDTRTETLTKKTNT